MTSYFIRLGRMAAAVFILCVSVTSGNAAGALPVGKWGAYGQAFDYRTQAPATKAAKAQCRGECRTVAMNRACAAFSIDLRNPCGAHAYAVAPRISSALNASMKDCYKYGGKECVIRAWACDARG